MNADQANLPPEIRQTMDLPAVRDLHERAAPGVTLVGVAGIYREAVDRGGYGAATALSMTERAVSGSRDATEALRIMRQMIPGPKAPVVDGRTVRISLAVGVPSRHLVAGRSGEVNTRESATRFTLADTCRVLWAHQRGPVWDRAAAQVGAILAHRTSPIGDLDVWVRVDRADLAELALFGLLGASPGIANDSPASYGWSARTQEPTRIWANALVREMSLTPKDAEALACTVTAVRVVPSDATTWASDQGSQMGQQPQRWADPAPADAAPLQPIRRTPGGMPYQTRSNTQMGLAPLRVRR